ncbi:hypothetical protein GCM10027431_15670 [Lysobacter rhizosphaerae]
MKHPLHPALVHFPVACWSLATLADLASLRWAPAWHYAGPLMAAGVVTALAAMAAGFVELLKLGDDHPANADANCHMLLAMTALSCYGASLFLRLEGMTFTRPDAIGIAVGAAGFIALCLTGWLGGKLVYVHGVGVGRTRAPGSKDGDRPPRTT